MDVHGMLTVGDEASTSGQSGVNMKTEGSKAGEENKASPSKQLTEEEQTLLRSVFVKNVDFAASVEEIKQHFKECGEILRVTICYNKVTRKPLGHCYIEFGD